MSPELTEAPERNAQVSSRACAFKRVSWPSFERLYAALLQMPGSLAVACAAGPGMGRAATAPARSSVCRSARLGLCPCPNQMDQRHLHLLLPQRLELTLRCRRCAPPPRPIPATPCTQPPGSPPAPIRTHARPCTVVCLRRSPAAPRALPRPFSGKPYLRVGKPTRHLAFGNSLWHDPIQRRTRFLTHLPSLPGLIGVSSHTRPPESSTGAPAPAV